MLFYNCKITKIGQCLTHMNSLQQYAIFLTLSYTHTHTFMQAHTTPDVDLEKKMWKLPHYY